MSIRVHHYTEGAKNLRFLISDLGTISHDGVTVDASVEQQPGLLMAIVDDIAVAWDPEAEDGSEVLAGILDDRVLEQGDGATEPGSITARLAEVKPNLLVYPVGTDEDDVVAALKALNIIVRG